MRHNDDKVTGAARKYLQTNAHIIEVGYDTPTLIMCRQTYFK